MDKSFTCTLLLLLSLSAALGKYVYISDKMSWHRAQKYCRAYHTDLAPISNENDNDKLSDKEYSWIGLQRSRMNRNKWRWSGGRQVSGFFWDSSQPQNREDEDYGLIHRSRWHDEVSHEKMSFICYSAIVVRERKTWEEALEYCREHHHDLASVMSNTEMMLINKELGKNQSTDSVWIGLHFFSGEWLWVDGETLSYKHWGPNREPVCPNVKLVCAALRRKGSNNGTAVTLDVDTMNDSGGTNATAGVKLVWEAHDCGDRLHFICY